MQRELYFGASARPEMDGVSLWRKQREEEQLALAKKLGLPIGRTVEVWLRGGVRLRGKLHLHEETLIYSAVGHDPRFAVDGTPFKVSEMESCIES